MSDTYMQAAAELARAAGNRALPFFGTDLDVQSKSDGSPVTIADRGTEQFAREWIQDRFPSDGILGEEFGGDGSQKARRWIVDPIDGTKSFVRGVPLWGTLVAVQEADTVIAGAAYFPALREMIVAAPGSGCWWNDKRCSVSPVDHLSLATILTTGGLSADKRERWEALERESALSRTWGDCYGYFLVATGRAEVMMDPAIAAWDIAPFVPIIAEAGGVLTDWGGESPMTGKNAIATNAALGWEVRQILCANNDTEQKR